jgi:hypothetical protein
MLDSSEGEDVDTLRCWEEDIFQIKIKGDSSWKGSMKENKEADKKVAAIIKSSMKYDKEQVQSKEKRKKGKGE